MVLFHFLFYFRVEEYVVVGVSKLGSPVSGLTAGNAHGVLFRGTLPLSNHILLGPYSRAMPRALRLS